MLQNLKSRTDKNTFLQICYRNTSLIWRLSWNSNFAFRIYFGKRKYIFVPWTILNTFLHDYRTRTEEICPGNKPNGVINLSSWAHNCKSKQRITEIFVYEVIISLGEIEWSFFFFARWLIHFFVSKRYFV